MLFKSNQNIYLVFLVILLLFLGTTVYREAQINREIKSLYKAENAKITSCKISTLIPLRFAYQIEFSKDENTVIYIWLDTDLLGNTKSLLKKEQASTKMLSHIADNITIEDITESWSKSGNLYSLDYHVKLKMPEEYYAYRIKGDFRFYHFYVHFIADDNTDDKKLQFSDKDPMFYLYDLDKDVDISETGTKELLLQLARSMDEEEFEQINNQINNSSIWLKVLDFNNLVFEQEIKNNKEK